MFCKSNISRLTYPSTNFFINSQLIFPRNSADRQTRTDKVAHEECLPEKTQIRHHPQSAPDVSSSSVLLLVYTQLLNRYVLMIVNVPRIGCIMNGPQAFTFSMFIWMCRQVFVVLSQLSFISVFSKWRWFVNNIVVDLGVLSLWSPVGISTEMNGA